MGEARNASEFNQICTFLYQYIKSSKDWSNDIYLALKNDGHLDLDKERPKLLTTKSVITDKETVMQILKPEMVCVQVKN